MDFVTLIGLFLGVFAILIGQFLEGGHIASLFNVSAFIIVVGGTCGAVMIETPWKVFVRSIVILPWIFLPPKINVNEQIKSITNWSMIAKKNGILGLESVLTSEIDDFTKRALMLLIDKGDAKIIRSILNFELEKTYHSEIEAAKVFENMGGYSPTIGIIGAVIGLIQVMGNLSDPHKLGVGIAIAFVATVYGVSFANLFLLPVSNKLRRVIANNIKVKEMVVEGLASISEGDNLHILEMKLLGFTK